jgi:serine/threonine-protein kinase
MDFTCVKPWRREQPTTTDDAREFRQERLAYLGRVYGTIGISFYAAGNLAASLLGQVAPRPLLDLESWLVPVVCLIYFTQWLLCRRGTLSETALRAIDGMTTTLAAYLNSLMMFTTMPADSPGMAYTRALLLVTFGLLGRAILVPSSAQRTFGLGALATVLTSVTAYSWSVAQSPPAAPVTQTVMTALWCLGAVVIATLASHVTFGLRREVREARRFGQYTLIEKIGEGGMGAVYRASHAMLRRPTAIKLLRPADSGADRVRRFEREVQLTSQLTHPNTISIFDYGQTPDGVFYYAMEYLEGLNLEELVRIDGPQPPERVAHILRQVAASLAEAHDIGLVHRDIKPSNVILVPERAGAADMAKVVDFGLVKELDEDAGLTREGRLAGTPHYLAPEMLTSRGQATPQSDLYSLGCVGYYLVTGQRVFEGRSIIEVCSHHLGTPPTPPSQRLGYPVPESLSRLLMACLEKTPARRPASAAAIVEMIDASRDMRAWTADVARTWWRVQGPLVLAKRQPPAPVGDEERSLVTASVAV